VYTAYENNESKVIMAYCEGVLKKHEIHPRTVNEGFTGGVEV